MVSIPYQLMLPGPVFIMSWIALSFVLYKLGFLSLYNFLRTGRKPIGSSLRLTCTEHRAVPNETTVPAVRPP